MRIVAQRGTLFGAEAFGGFLQDHLEEEGANDRDYYMTRETIEEFAASAGATEHLVTILRGALRNDNALEIRWERDSV